MTARNENTWAYLVREGFEEIVAAELGTARKPRIVADGLVLGVGRNVDEDGRAIEPTFARRAIEASPTPAPIDTQEIAKRLASMIPDGPWALHVTATDARDPRDPRMKAAAAIDASIGEALEASLPRAKAEAFVEDIEEARWVVDVVVYSKTQALLAVTRVADLMQPMRASRSRSRKVARLEEALSFVGVTPGKGETVAELGGRGAWGLHVAAMGAKVTFVGKDPGLDPNPSITRVVANPFEAFAEETFDWLIVDMPRRAIEVTRLIGKWGRRGWARQVIATLPLLPKEPLDLLDDARGLLREAGWRGIRFRQLPSDQDQVTLVAWLDPKIAVRGPKEPFGARMLEKKRERDARTQRRERLRKSRELKRKKKAEAREL